MAKFKITLGKLPGDLKGKPKLIENHALDLLFDFDEKYKLSLEDYGELEDLLTKHAEKGEYPTDIKHSSILVQPLNRKVIDEEYKKMVKAEKSTLNKKGPKDIKPKTVDETAASFEKLEEGPISTNEYPNMGKEEGPGFKKPRSYVEVKKEPKISLPEGKERVSKAGKKLAQFGEKLSEKAKGKTADFERLYGGALDDVMDDIKGGKFPSDAQIPYNPEYTADLMTRAQKELGKAGKTAKKAIQQESMYVDLLGERLKDAAPKIPKPIKPPPFDMGFDPEFNGAIPPRLEPPPIPKEAMTENLYDPKAWQEFAKEQPIEPEVNWREWEPQKLLGGPPEPPTGNRGRVIPNSWEGYDFAKRGGGPSTSIEGLENMLQKMMGKGEDATSLMKEAAGDAAKFMKKNNMSSMEVLGKVGKTLPWIAWGVITYQFLFGDKAKAQAMALETGLPLWPGVDFGEELGTGSDDPYALPEGPDIQEGASIQDYAALSRGRQG